VRFPVLVSILLIAAGLWMAGLGFMEEPAAAPGPRPAHTVSAPPSATSGKLSGGLALMAGGVLLLIIATRRQR
jgi:hypothetical protein